LIDEHAGLDFCGRCAGLLVAGAWRGLVYEVLSLLGWLVAFVVARTWAQEVAVWLPLDGWDMQLRYAAGFVLLLVGSMFAWGVISWLSKQLIEAVGLRPVDRTLGALFGVCAVACCCWCWLW
jgi:membrane protein required for colicin V production